MLKRLFMVCMLFTTHGLKAQSENFWILRTGVVGTGTFDDGIWHFKDATGLGTQTFTFQNSWGVSMGAEYVYRENWSTGIYTSFSHTGFEVQIETPSRGLFISESPTSFVPVLLEQKYRFQPQKRFVPHIGLVAGILFTRNLSLNLPQSSRPESFTFLNPFIYGVIIGLDYKIGESDYIFHFQIRALEFKYGLEENEFVPAQTPLDQDFYQNPNHVMVGIAKKLY